AANSARAGSPKSPARGGGRRDPRAPGAPPRGAGGRRRAGPPAPKPDRWRRTSRIHTLKDSRRLAIVRELWTARDELAARRDIAPGRVLPDSAIVAAAEAAPRTVEELRALPVFGGPRQRRSSRIWLGA
ncbi:HRDC domain-containing protein, partial [Klebsiella pneumoniae]|nr:HRDC domain-containing protein [Klebsiella pneumoniae]